MPPRANKTHTSLKSPQLNKSWQRAAKEQRGSVVLNQNHTATEAESLVHDSQAETIGNSTLNLQGDTHDRVVSEITAMTVPTQVEAKSFSLAHNHLSSQVKTSFLFLLGWRSPPFPWPRI